MISIKNKSGLGVDFKILKLYTEELNNLAKTPDYTERKNELQHLIEMVYQSVLNVNGHIKEV